MQADVLDADSIAKTLGLGVARTNELKHNPQRCPPAAGKVGASWYWVRHDVERWVEAHPSRGR